MVSGKIVGQLQPYDRERQLLRLRAAVWRRRTRGKLIGPQVRVIGGVWPTQNK
jgi:hypothetical protein